MRGIITFALIAVATTACGLTGPSASIAGGWRAPGIGHNGQYFDLALTQSGDKVSGVMCGSDGGFLLFKDVPVSGELPTVTFVVPATGARYDGTFEDDRDQIAGELVGFSSIPLRFVRSEGGRCAGARPLP